MLGQWVWDLINTMRAKRASMYTHVLYTNTHYAYCAQTHKTHRYTFTGCLPMTQLKAQPEWSLLIRLWSLAVIQIKTPKGKADCNCDSSLTQSSEIGRASCRERV